MVDQKKEVEVTDSTDPDEDVEAKRKPSTCRIRRFDPVTRNYKICEADLSERRRGSDRYYTSDGNLITGE